jgi:hypothetical protein
MVIAPVTVAVGLGVEAVVGGCEWGRRGVLVNISFTVLGLSKLMFVRNKHFQIQLPDRLYRLLSELWSALLHTSAYVSIYVIIHQHTSAYASIRRHNILLQNRS